MKINKLGSSYRDPSGFVFSSGGRIFRQINPGYKNDYDRLMGSGLYDKLVSRGLLVAHKEIGLEPTEGAYKIIEPQRIPFISYPYEWTFSQLKDAALRTLEIQKIAMDFGMVLKDASSFNIQFLEGNPVFIDTLSFEKYNKGEPWVAYRQFCEHFLGPLALSAYADIRLFGLMEVCIDGIGLDLAAKLLPFKARLKPGLYFHIYLHSLAQKKIDNAFTQKTPKSEKKFGEIALKELIDNLTATVKKINLKTGKTVWTDYDANDCESYEPGVLDQKKELVGRYLEMAAPKTLWDIGANSGAYSRIAAKLGIFTVSIDNDPTVVEKNYLDVKKDGEKNILPLLADIANPTPALGWRNAEREPLLGRQNPDAVLALALVHHLAIAKNIPFSMQAELFAGLCGHLIVEFVPKGDKRVRRLLRFRKDIFNDYDILNFEAEFGKFFEIKEKTVLPGSGRVLYLMVNKSDL